MKPLFIFLAAILVLPFSTKSQSISINSSTPYASCSGQTITVAFTVTGSLPPPYTIELVERIEESSYGGGCNSTNHNTLSTTTTNTLSGTINIPVGHYTRGVSGECRGFWPMLTMYSYSIKVKSGSIENSFYPIQLVQNCSPVINPRIEPSPICAGKPGIVKWYSAGAISGNVYTVELSDASGGFSSATVLGTITGNNADGMKSFSFTAPAGATSSDNYKIKVKSSNPVSEDETSISIGSSEICGPVRNVTASSSQMCSPSTGTVNFELHDTFLSGNTFTAQLSDSNGDFSSPTNIGSVTSQTGTSIPVSIPSALQYGSSYKIRVIASLPSSGISFTSGSSSNIKIGLYTPYLSGSTSVCTNSKMELSLYTSSDFYPKTDYTFEWRKNDVNVNAQNQSTENSLSYEYFERTNTVLSDSGAYTIKVTRIGDGCAIESSPITVSINALPFPPAVSSPITVVNGQTATLTASGCSGDVYWFSSATASGEVGYDTFITPELTQQTTYYASCRSSSTYCYSSRVPLLININAAGAPAPPTLTASHNDFCSGSVTIPKITATGCTGTVRWYRKLGNSWYLEETQTSAPYEITASNYSSAQYQADCRQGGVLSTTRSELAINVKFVPYAPNVNPNYITINNGSTVTFSSWGCSGTVKWYADESKTTLLGSGNSYTTSALTNPGTENNTMYSVYPSCTLNGCEGFIGYVNLTISNTLVAPNLVFPENKNNACSGSSTTIRAVGCSNGTVNWYNTDTGGMPIATGQSYTTPVLTYDNLGNNSYNYYADCTIGANTSSRGSVSFHIYAQPGTPSANQPTIACNTSTVLTATGCNTSSPEYFTAMWYESSTSDYYLSYNSTFTTPILTANKTYYLQCIGSADCKSARVPITVTVTCTPPDAPLIATSAVNICASTGVNLTATGCAGTVNWSDGGTGTSRTNVVFPNTINLTATCTVGSLVSSNSNQITITVNSKPNLVITNPPAATPPTTVSITAAAITVGSTLPAGTSLSYHTNAAGTTTLTTPGAIATSGTYYIKATTAAGCTDIKPVVVVISNCATVINLTSNSTNNYASGTHVKKTSQTITASNMLSGTANVTYRSNKAILLTPENGGGFSVAPGAVFKAEIGGCE